MIKVKQKTKILIPTYRLFAKTGMFQDYRACYICGQNKIPFKKGVCPRCCNQVGKIQYVKDPREYVQSNYGAINVNKMELYAEEDLDEK